MRVIAGIYRGRKLAAPPGEDVRPTSDKVKEALFSMLASIASPLGGDAPLAGKSCLDLFAGTGALGVEALSRGAASCVFVESSRTAAEALAENIERVVGAGPSARLMRTDWRLALRRLSGGARDRPDARVDIAFVDPPYEAGYYDEVKKTLLDYDIISDGGIVTLERPSPGKDYGAGAGRRARGGAYRVHITGGPQRGEERYEGFALIRERRYGKTVIEVYERAAPAAAEEAPDAGGDDAEGSAGTRTGTLR
jgi:16S rRNA (guanine(966)-N(2))-methyltransferase RsmD